jgi:2-polyprenyl-3-methyl-5-hydroxy-6-metoxy-1,4-benzoquinol methylase
MANMTSRFDYFLWAFKRWFLNGPSANTCPACGASDCQIVHRKYAVTALRQCRSCSLRFRTPKDNPETAETFYVNEVYKQGFTTDLPSEAELQVMLANRFSGTEKDFGERLEALAAAGLKPGARILDFGCSWGYGSWQMRQAGYDVFSYEIGRERARYAKEKLQCTMVSDLGTLDNTIDCFFSSHVIEHLPNPRIMFDAAEKALRPGGLFVCYAPNGAVESERKNFAAYHHNWGKVHPLMMTPQFMKAEASRRGFIRCAVFSSPVDAADIQAARDGHLEGDELLAIGVTDSNHG